MSEGSEAITFAAWLDGGELKADEVNATKGRLNRWGRGRRQHVTVTVRRYVKSKTNQQLAYYFGPVLDAWSEWTGYDKDEMDYELRRAYLAPVLVVARLTGEETYERPSLARLDVEQMSAYLERVLREGRQHGIEFPEAA